ncbi:MAG: DUF1801 domain-containing protein [Xanthomonadales bacterium]|nr:DUF1801 domain-containing protein [Xanthomonadales bacterium]
MMHDGQATACIGEAAFACIGVHAKHVSVGFFRGAELADPLCLLEGRGKLLRHVKLRPDRWVDEAALRALVEAACERVRKLRNG